MRKALTLGAAVAACALLLLMPTTGGSSPVAANDELYLACGRVFPDPHAFWPSPTQSPGRSPFAKGNAACASTDFLQYEEMVDGLEYLRSLFPRFVTFYKLNEDFGPGGPCSFSTSPADFCSAGLPKLGTRLGREKQELYMVRVSDGASNAGKKLFAFPLSIHGIERAGAEAGVRATEDLATWAYCEALAKGELGSNSRTNCAQEGQIPHRLLEADAAANSITAGDALKRTAIYFVFANPDGWKRGDRDNVIRFYQRYNGNGVDLNRDWPTIGFTYKPYTPWSEPETRSFGKVLKKVRSKWDGGIDLHGQLIDRAFSFTLLGASQRDYAKNQRILQVAKGAWADAEARLAWSPLIKPNDAPATCVGTPVGGALCDRMYGVQWGTVWDTIDYTVTGALGDWIDSPMGLNADGIDNEMSMSHLINCGVGSCWLPDAEQLHVDGNKSLVYSMVNYSLVGEDQKFRIAGTAAYVRDPKVLSDPGTPAPTPFDGLREQSPILNVLLTPANSYRYEFTVEGPDQGVYNGGLEAKVTVTNAGGVGNGMVSSLILERKLGPSEEPEEPGAAGCDADRTWTEVNRYWNQSEIYIQAGGAVQANLPLPGQWRVCLLDLLENTAGVASLDIGFSREKTWEDPGQVPYSVTNMRFFDDLRKFAGVTRLVPVSPTDAASGAASLSAYDNLILADNWTPEGVADPAAWAAKLRAYVEGGGNLVLTDGALKALEGMGVVPAGRVSKRIVYAGNIGFTTNGTNETYNDPLAKNVDQPGAAEGSGHRHQTYEPVPIGYSIQNAAGDDLNTSPAWTVQQTAWQAAGGRTVGTTGNGWTSLGELTVGKGRIRIIGALVPMPTEQYYHPFGLSNYAVTYTGYQVLNNILQWKRPA